MWITGDWPVASKEKPRESGLRSPAAGTAEPNVTGYGVLGGKVGMIGYCTVTVLVAELPALSVTVTLKM